MRNGSHTVVVTSQLFGTQTDAGLRLLREHGFRVLENAAGKYHTEEDVIARAAEAEAIVCDMEPITARVMDAAPRLRIIARRGVGTDAVDTAEAARRGIAVARTTGALENSVADLVMAFLLALARRLPELDREVKAGRWRCSGSSGSVRSVWP
jgi:D-3-phosphoglycerate dehydrogenase